MNKSIVGIRVRSDILLYMNFLDLPKHHAVLFVTSARDNHGKNIFSELQTLSPVHRFFNQTVLDIETARSIISWAQTPYNNEEKVAVISFHSIGLEAQNALLKILEEPRDGVRFILITGNRQGLIDTVLSRVCLVEDNQSNTVSTHKDAELFLTTLPVLRMKLPCVVELLSSLDEEGRKNREMVKNFITNLIPILVKEKVDPKYLQETLIMASYASDPSASGKALLEYLSLLLPQTSR